MFLKFFRKKTELEKLSFAYKRLLQEAFDLSTINRKESDSKQKEADLILKKIETLKAT